MDYFQWQDLNKKSGKKERKRDDILSGEGAGEVGEINGGVEERSRGLQGGWRRNTRFETDGERASEWSCREKATVARGA